MIYVFGTDIVRGLDKASGSPPYKRRPRTNIFGKAIDEPARIEEVMKDE